MAVIRKASWLDIPPILMFRNKISKETEWLSKKTLNEIENYVTKSHVYVCIESGIVVGEIVASFSGERIFINSLGVLYEYGGQSIGKRLMSF